MNSIWLIIVAAAAFAVAYRLYGAFLAAKVAVLDDAKVTPAHRLTDGVDYHPTSKWVLFGHHFAAIAGPGPLIGPVLAAQWGWAPGFGWIVIGACLAGGAHDFVILLASVRMNGKSLPEIARQCLGPAAGLIAAIATAFIVVAVLASVGMVVVTALSKSPWGVFAVLVTIPAAVLTGLWMYKIRPGKVAEASVIGVSIVVAGVVLGKPFADSPWAHCLLFDAKTLSMILPVYAFITSILPVWVLMCPRDYLSSYMKIGVMTLLGVGLLIAAPHLQMPATTPFLNGGGPVGASSGSVWPFVCIVIMCGALSGFHALIASGTTPKMVGKESDIKAIGYGAMLVEGFVSVTALIAACALHPGDYFAINVAQETLPQQQAYHRFMDHMQAVHGWNVQPHELAQMEAGTGEKLAGRTGGAVTLAVGMSKVFCALPGMKSLMGYWYHFVIMFEALFILTLLETGTRVARFVFEECVLSLRPAAKGRAQPGAEVPPMWESGETVGENPIEAAAHAESKPNWRLNVLISAITCALWGYLLYRGDLGTLWQMLGIANQLLAALALAIGTTWLLMHAKKKSHALVTFIPFVLTFTAVMWAGVVSVGKWWAEAQAAGTAPEKSFQLKLMCVMAAAMMGMVLVIAGIAAGRWRGILREGRLQPT